MDKKYKALIVDFDGTLVGLDFIPTDKVKKAIKKLLDTGYKVCIATGRRYQGKVEEICRILNLTDPQIAGAGSQIIDPKTGKALWTDYISEKDSKSIIDFLIKNNTPFAVESGEYVFLEDEQLKTRYGSGLSFKKIKELDLNKVSKVFVPDISLVNSLRSLFPNLNVIVAGLSIRHALDITSKNASKELAVLELSKILNIDPKDMVGAGDGYNDIPLLTACGYKVAMDNAPQELKKIADLIIPDVEHDGLVTLISRL